MPGRRNDRRTNETKAGKDQFPGRRKSGEQPTEQPFEDRAQELTEWAHEAAREYEEFEAHQKARYGRGLRKDEGGPKSR